MSVSLDNAQALTCTGVANGNTIVLSNGEKVRLIGVAIPSTKQLNKSAEYIRKETSAFTKQMVEGKEIKLEHDQQERDNQGQSLAYVFLLDGTFLNAEVIKQGYGRVDASLPFKYLNEFHNYQKEAQQAKSGLWAAKSTVQEPKYIREYYMGAKNSTIYHQPNCSLIRKVNPLDRKMFNSVKDAVNAGYVPCKICKPPYYK
jgi:micrococcal nuclease